MFTKLIFLSLLFQPAPASVQPEDTIINGVRIEFEYTSSIFPETWLDAPVNALGDPISLSEIARSKKVMVKAFRKYPVVVLKQNLVFRLFSEEYEILQCAVWGHQFQ